MSLYCIDEGLKGVVGHLPGAKVCRRVRTTTPTPGSLELQNYALKNELKRRLHKQFNDKQPQLTTRLERPLELLRQLEAQSRNTASHIEDFEPLFDRLEAAILKDPGQALQTLNELRLAVFSAHFQSESTEAQLRLLQAQKDALKREMDKLQHHHEKLVRQEAFCADSALAAVCELFQQKALQMQQGSLEDFTDVPLHLPPALKAQVTDSLRVLQLALNTEQQRFLQTIQSLSNELVQLRQRSTLD